MHIEIGIVVLVAVAHVIASASAVTVSINQEVETLSPSLQRAGQTAVLS